MAATDMSYWHMFQAFRSRDNVMEGFASMLNTIGSEVNLVSVKSGLTLGPGEGLCEIGFIKKCAANIGKLIAVEQDHVSAERLKHNLRKSLPNVEAQVIETSCCTWKGPDDPVDLVLMFQMFHYCKPGERKRLLKKLYDGWLAAGGFVVVLSESNTKVEGESLIFQRLGRTLVMWKDIEADLLEVGFIKQREYEMQITRDFSNPDESFLRFYQSHAGRPVTLDDVRDAMKELYPDGRAELGFNKLAVFQRAH